MRAGQKSPPLRRQWKRSSGTRKYQQRCIWHTLPPMVPRWRMVGDAARAQASAKAAQFACTVSLSATAAKVARAPMRTASPSSTMPSMSGMVFRSMTVSGYVGRLSSFSVPRRSVPPAMNAAVPASAFFAASFAEAACMCLKCFMSSSSYCAILPSTASTLSGVYGIISMKSPPVAFWMAWPTSPGFAWACATPVDP